MARDAKYYVLALPQRSGPRPLQALARGNNVMIRYLAGGGTGMGRILATFQPESDLSKIWFMRKRVS